MIIKLRKPELVQVGFFDRNAKLVYKSILAIVEKEQVSKSDEITFILLITVFVLFFFARSLGAFLFLLLFGLFVSIFAWIKLYKERGGKTMKRRRIFRIIERGIKFLKELLLGGAKFKW